jgi:N-acetylmuramic acid 6-phosphate etherase
MVDLVASNQKLKQRSRNILRKVSKHCSVMTDQYLDDLLTHCNGRVKLAIVVAEKGLSIEQSQRELDMAKGVLANVLAVENGSQVEEPLVNGSSRRQRVLCIDGGGSKCAAVAGTLSDNTGNGVAGPCNLYEPQLLERE